MSETSAVALKCCGCGSTLCGNVPRRKCPECHAHGWAPSYFCSEECQRANWKQHRKWHKTNLARIEKAVREGRTRPPVLGDAPEREGDPRNDYLIAGNHALNAHDYEKAAKYYRRDIKENPDEHEGYWALAKALGRSGDFRGAAEVRLESLKRCRVGTVVWASIQLECVTNLRMAQCAELPKPAWWNDAELLRLSQKCLAILQAGADDAQVSRYGKCKTQEVQQALTTRASILEWADGLPPKAGPRTTVQYVEAVRCWEQAYRLSSELGKPMELCMKNARTLRAHLDSCLRGGPPNPHDAD